MGIVVQEKRLASRRSGIARRQAQRRTLDDRREVVIDVLWERRVGARRFIERRNEIRRRLDDRRRP